MVGKPFTLKMVARFVWFVLFIWLNQTSQMNQTNRTC